MAEYIDKATAVDIMNAKAELGVCSEYAACFHNAAKMLEILPAADVVPVRHGVWNGYEDDFGEEMVYQCSVCKAEFVLAEGSPKDNGYCYCPSCGARLDYDDE